MSDRWLRRVEAGCWVLAGFLFSVALGPPLVAIERAVLRLDGVWRFVLFNWAMAAGVAVGVVAGVLLCRLLERSFGITSRRWLDR